MIKCVTLGMIDGSVNNPVIKLETDTKNYQFVTVDGDVYLIANTLVGDDFGKEDVTFKAGEYLDGYLVKKWDTQELDVDEKHIAYASDKSYADLAKDNILTIDGNGKLAVAESAPATGVYFKIVDKCRLTEKAVRVKVIVA